jgi:hypothetical protein
MNENFSERTKTGKGIPRIFRRIALCIVITLLPSLLLFSTFVLPVLPSAFLHISRCLLGMEVAEICFHPPT